MSASPSASSHNSHPFTGYPGRPTALSRSRLLLALCISVLLLVPCVWQRHIEAGDLGSHTYNAWLAQLIEKGEAPGLYTVRQYDNVLVDWALLHATSAFGFVAGEKLVVGSLVLLFFWSVFLFIAAVAGRAPWLLSPAIAMLTYGYAFHLGFLNYLASLGFACLGLSFVWNGGGRAGHWLACAASAFFAMLAHPIGFLFLLGMLAYRFSRNSLAPRYRWIVPVLAISAFVLLRIALVHQHVWAVDWSRDEPAYFYNGVDQLILYGERYAKLALAVGLFVLFCAAFGLVADKEERRSSSLLLAIELYAVAFIAIALLPENLRPFPEGGWIGLLVSRLTIIPAIFALCVLASFRPRAWQLAGLAAAALAFFSFLYADSRWLNRMEANAQSVLANVPRGTRIIWTIVPPSDWRAQFIGHLVERACIGHCFVYSNYEAPTRQFRIRVSPQGSPLVTSSNDDAEDMAGGAYDVQDTDPPLKQLYQCDPHDLTKLCMHDLHPGDNTGALLLHP
ncbi:MAG TPA: hypothetical protein VJP87_02565 [Candidatus Acidoferrales bacterium]|nr:hypothetical protein [Candidatus Acidoferrales bacterium]